MKISGVELKLPRISLAIASETWNIQSAEKKRRRGGGGEKKKDQIDRSILHGHAIMPVRSTLQRAFPHGQLRKTAAIDLRAVVTAERNGHVGFSFRVINSFASSVYIHSAARRCARIHHFTILPAWVG